MFLENRKITEGDPADILSRKTKHQEVGSDWLDQSEFRKFNIRLQEIQQSIPNKFKHTVF